MIQFSKLRLSGFKSFVDKTELEIGAGLNGIVGPNGCGKSNLVEALRWVMGESSAKRMRGGGMEDVIFAGTDQRGARSFAEVSLLLNNSTRTAPSAYNDSDEIEVTRRIEKDRGSGYKINGKNARARDVQMLFADTVTGANSPSLVSQGHVTRMINAKPHDRRLILEESAGIAGLYARRHEAELRLKAADGNLLRLEDVVGSMESRLNSLKRQSRQASNYKNLNAQIKQLELVVTYLEWQDICDKRDRVKKEFGDVESIVAENLVTVTQLTKTQNTQIEDLPPLRKAEAEMSARLQKHKLDFQQLEDEVTRHQKDLAETKEQLNQTSIDLSHEKETAEETSSLLERADSEYKALLKAQESDEQTYKEKETLTNTNKLRVTELESRLNVLKDSASESRAREESLQRTIERHQAQIAVLLERRELAEQARANLNIDKSAQDEIKKLEAATQSLEQSRVDLNEKTDALYDDFKKSEESLESARQQDTTSEKEYAEFSAELSTLEHFLENDEDHQTVLDKITTKSGFEKALSRALGDSLMASLEDAAPSTWQKSKVSIDGHTLPKGLECLKDYVEAPAELSLALSQIGYVQNQQDGEKASKTLKVGQSIVSADGYYWRWDGFHVQAHATDRHSIHLEQKNKLKSLLVQKQKFEEQKEQASQKLKIAQEQYSKAKSVHEEHLDTVRETEQKLRNLRPALQGIKDKNIRSQSEQKRYDDQITAIHEDVENLQNALEVDQVTYNTLVLAKEKNDDDSNLIPKITAELDRGREEYQSALLDFDMFKQAQSTRNARIQAIADERVSLKNRSIRANEHLKTLAARKTMLEEKLKTLEAQPLNKKNGHEDLLSVISDAEKMRDVAAEKLVSCEEEISVTNKALKEAEATLNNAREDRARTQATLSAIVEQLSALELSIEERLEIKPKDLVKQSALDLVKYQITDLQNLKQDREKLTRQRDGIGPVNLRAEDEATELEKELTTLLHERNDLVQAIEELRGGINKINKEAREKLLIAFDHVNAHFQRLFVRLFAGGKAHLELINSDDPLGAGLEIFAQPPGKSLQALSLLSGGEQTLASIALIFGMFLTNPSPICVLDEIDAPLDDANVNRVCDLLDEISERGETRFMVITHHRLSMARMDRLYGVTMSERGVSQLVSVDLQQSFDFVDQKVA